MVNMLLATGNPAMSLSFWASLYIDILLDDLSLHVEEDRRGFRLSYFDTSEIQCSLASMLLYMGI